MDEGAPKSSYELAMERLRKKDADEGISDKPLSDEQRKAIAEARGVYEARVAEREILHQSAVRQAQSPEVVETLTEEFRRDKERFANDRDAKIAAIRG
jgi:hypothetical protein